MGTIVRTMTLGAKQHSFQRTVPYRGADADGAKDGPDRIVLARIDAAMDRIFVLCLGLENSVYTARARGRGSGVALAAQ